MALHKPIELFVAWLSFAASAVLGLGPFLLVAALAFWLLPADALNAEVRQLGFWWVPLLALGALWLALGGFGVYTATHLWLTFAEPRFSRWAIGLVVGGEQHLPKMRERNSRLLERARRLTRRCS